MFISHSSLSQEWHFSQLNQGGTAPKSHRPMWKKASCIGWEEKGAHLCVAAAPSFFSGKSWNGALYAATDGMEKRENLAKPGFEEPLQQSLCL